MWGYEPRLPDEVEDESFAAGRIWGVSSFSRIYAIAAFALLALVGLIFFDPVLMRLARSSPPDVIHFFRLITGIGRSWWMLWPSLTAIAVLSVLFRREASRKLSAVYQHFIGVFAYLVATIALSSLIYHVLKVVFGRARPIHFDVHGHLYFWPFSFSSDFASFPSGHAATIFAFATAIALMWRSASVPLFIMAVLVAVSRIFVGKHYFIDVAAGAAVGIWAALAVRRWFAARGIVFARRQEGRMAVKGRAIFRWLARRIGRAAAGH